MIIGHVSGLTSGYKNDFMVSFNDSKYYIVDLDDYTDEIMKDNNMQELVVKYDDCIVKSKDPTTTKNQVKVMLAKSRELNNKINDFWKKRMEFYLNELSNESTKDIILIGSISFFRNIRTILNLDISIKSFLDLDNDTYAREIIETNLDIYRDEIVSGHFNLEMINHVFFR